MTTKIKPVQTITHLSVRNKFAFLFSLIAFLFLFPGIYLSMLTLATNGSLNASVPHMESDFIGIPKESGTENKHIPIKVFDTTRSILTTIQHLWDSQLYFVSSMIFLFSVIVPLVKSISITYAFFSKSSVRRNKVFNFIKAIGKWSMCDVFVVSILLAYLSTGASQTNNAKDVSFMGHSIHVDVMVGMHAHLQVGFWCFVTYCLVSLLALQLYEPY
jgi:paraquat-inducible protein A